MNAEDYRDKLEERLEEFNADIQLTQVKANYLLEYLKGLENEYQ